MKGISATNKRQSQKRTDPATKARRTQNTKNRKVLRMMRDLKKNPNNAQLARSIVDMCHKDPSLKNLVI